MEVQQQLIQGLTENKAALMVMLDYSAAFDTVNSNIILEIIRTQLGISLSRPWPGSDLNRPKHCTKQTGQSSLHQTVV